MADRPTPKQITEAVLALRDAFMEAIKAAGPMGCPGGLLYSAVIDKMSMRAFENFMDSLVAAGAVTKKGQLYFLADRTKYERS